jgi:hypothetical protein
VLADATTETAGGSPLARHLIATDPAVRTLFMIDPSDDGVTGGGLAEGTPTIQRPFTLQGLAEKVREVLDSAGQSSVTIE